MNYLLSMEVAINNITSTPVAHMYAQIRGKQLSTKSSQDNLKEKITLNMKEQTEVSGKNLINQIKENLSNWLKSAKKLILYLSAKQ